LVFASNRFGKQRGETNVFIADWVEWFQRTAHFPGTCHDMIGSFSPCPIIWPVVSQLKPWVRINILLPSYPPTCLLIHLSIHPKSELEFCLGWKWVIDKLSAFAPNWVDKS
jgi:hypothetical protein